MKIIFSYIRFILVLMILNTNAFAYRCNTDSGTWGNNSCNDVRAGIGILYSQFDASPKIDSNNGLFYLTSYMARYWSWLYLAYNADFALGYSKLNGNIVGDSISTHDTNVFIAAKFLFGTNLGSLQNPLFVSFAYSIEQNIFGFKKREQRFSLLPMFVGVNISGRYMFNHELGLEYELGYGYMPFARFVVFDPRGLEINGSNLYEASIGLIFRRISDTSGIKTETVYQPDADRISFRARNAKRFDFYTKIRFRYFNLNESKIGDYNRVGLIGAQQVQYPKSNNFMIMLEFGISTWGIQ